VSNSSQPQGSVLEVVLNLDHDLNRMAVREALELLARLELLVSKGNLSRDLLRSLTHGIGLRLSYFLLHSEPHCPDSASLRALAAHHSSMCRALQASQAADSRLSDGSPDSTLSRIQSHKRT